MALQSLVNSGFNSARNYDLAAEIGLRSKRTTQGLKDTNSIMLNSPLRDVARFLDANNISDPLFLRFKIFFDFSAKNGFLAEETNVNSALAYLKRIGDIARYQLLKDFIESLKIISSEYPFLMQDLDGLSEILAANPQCFIPDEQNIMIHCLETVDMKIQKLVTSYRKIVYDDVRRVEVIPNNLRRFGMHIFLYSMQWYKISQYYTTGDKIGEIDESNSYTGVAREILLRALPVAYVTDDGEKVIAAPNLFNHTVFRFDECEFDIKNTGADFLSSISNIVGAPAKNSLSIHPRYFEIDSEMTNIWGINKDSARASFAFLMALINEKQMNGESFNAAGFTNMTDSGISISGDIANDKASIWDKVKDTVAQEFKETFSIDNLKKLGAGAVDMIQQGIINAAENGLNKFLLGNVYKGFGISNIINAYDSLASGSITNVVSAANNMGVSIGKLNTYESFKNRESNVYPTVMPQTSGGSGQNVYSGVATGSNAGANPGAENIYVDSNKNRYSKF